jgi:hypothetical protein
MRGPEWNDSVVAERRAQVRDAEALAAFDALLAYGIAADHLAVAPGKHGHVRDIRFMAVEGKGWPFRLVPNQKDLLIHVRPLGVRRLKITTVELQGLFPEVGPGNKGRELKIRVRTEGDARNLITHVLDKWPRLEAQAVEAIAQRTDSGAAASEALIDARRGQGVYRSNLENVEQACRITGVLDRRHLRASHIKPWRDCSDFEKLDGFNGLLLSPHVEHLFEQGYISFSDEGRLLVSRWLNRVVLERWGIAVANQGRPFCAEQRVYLAWHRERVFEQEETGRRRLQKAD